MAGVKKSRGNADFRRWERFIPLIFAAEKEEES
jgi:hypothetical protein